ncbi:MAG: archaellin/type IV pilin N-terminal domain-containing protein [Methanomassiliicoccus sp.]|nr:archaellin/type IV pilin N-terminal domain-containing protein [Methanomassiliicoccus sp.]
MMKKMWKNRSGVSPVIATILMVAITVVLAAVLYVMVMGFGGSGTPTAPTASLTKNSSNQVVLTISPATEYTNLKIKVGDGTAVTLNASDATVGSGASLITVKYVDLGGDGKATTSDYFTVTKGANNPSSTLTLLWVNGDTTQSIASLAI